MSSGPGTKIIDVRDRGTRTVSGVEVRVEESVWNGTDGRSFDVYRVSDGACLTAEGSLDEMPGDEDIAQLILEYPDTPVEYWASRGCGTSYDTSDADMIGAGNPVTPRLKSGRCDKALDTASEVCPRCFSQHTWLLGD
jgi:hypothetical protein